MPRSPTRSWSSGRSESGINHSVDVNFAGLAGFLLAKAAAALGRHHPKDWYDIAFVLLHNDEGSVEHPAERVLECFHADLVGVTMTSILDLSSNFSSPTEPGAQAYAQQIVIDHPELEFGPLATDAHLAVSMVCSRLIQSTL